MYPISYDADPALEGRNRLTTFFRYIVAIPWLIVACDLRVRRRDRRR